MTEERAPKHPGVPYFESIAATLGETYLRYNFAKGTAQEVPFLLDVLGLEQGQRVLDVGCGPGRHSVALSQAGISVTGVDISRRFLDIAAERARAAGVSAGFFEVDARQMPFEDTFHAAIAICQGAFGLMGKDDSLIMRRMMEAVVPGGIVVITAFSAYFEARHVRPGVSFDAGDGIVHELTSVKDESGKDHAIDLWNTVYTPRELRLLAIGVGLVPEAVWSVAPGDFARRKPDLDHPELMLVARKPS
jgi:SAM-dependent methyltransferase